MTETTSALVVTLPSDLEIEMRRVFNAPRQMVWDAHTKPEHLRHWWGMGDPGLSTFEVDLRPGGGYRFVCVSPGGGEEYGFRGEYREIDPPKKLVQTFEFDGLPGHVSEETLTFIEEGGKTTLISLSRFANVEDRDGMLNSGVEAGASVSMDQLEVYLEKMAQG